MARSRWFCCCLPGCLAAVVVPLGLIATFLKLGSERPGDLPPPRIYTPAEIHQAKRHMDALKAQAEHDVRLAKKGKRIPFRYSVTEQDLNAELSRNPDVAGKIKAKGVTDVHVSLGKGVAAFQGAIPLGDGHLWIKAQGPLRGDAEGKVYFEPSQVEFGRLNWALPAAMKERMTGRLKTESERPILRVPGEIREIKIVPGKILIRGVTDPSAVRDSPPVKIAP